VTFSSAIFKIKIKENTVPIFSSPLANASVPLMTFYTYTFPKIIDPDYNAKTSISAIQDSATGFLPSFISLKKLVLTIHPTLIA
jgi:hypothetical protein